MRRNSSEQRSGMPPLGWEPQSFDFLGRALPSTVLEEGASKTTVINFEEGVFFIYKDWINFTFGSYVEVVVERLTRCLSKTCFSGLTKCCTSFHSKVPKFVGGYESWPTWAALVHCWKDCYFSVPALQRVAFVQLPFAQFLWESLSSLIMPQDPCWKDMLCPPGGQSLVFSTV